MSYIQTEPFSYAVSWPASPPPPSPPAPLPPFVLFSSILLPVAASLTCPPLLALAQVHRLHTFRGLLHPTKEHIFIARRVSQIYYVLIQNWMLHAGICLFSLFVDLIPIQSKVGWNVPVQFSRLNFPQIFNILFQVIHCTFTLFLIQTGNILH